MFVEILSFTIRVIAFYSKSISSMKSIVLFNNYLYSYSSIERDNFISNNYNIIEGHYSHVSFILSKLFQALNNNDNLKLVYFTLIDICNAKLLNKFKFYCNDKNDKAKNTSTVKILYLFNPITILSCISFNLSSVYILLLLIYITLKKNTIILKYTSFILAFMICPQYSVLLISYLFYESIYEKNIKKLSICLTLVISLCALLSFYLNINLLGIHVKYFTLTDNNPNIGLLWGILNETFLKFKYFSIYSILLYELMINLSVIYLMILIYKSSTNDIYLKETTDDIDQNDNKVTNTNETNSYINTINPSYFLEIKNCNKSICFMLLYLVYFICARIPSENDQILTACLIAAHYQIFKNVYLNFSVSL